MVQSVIRQIEVPLNENKLNRLLEEALFEDLGMGDITTEATVSPDAIGRGEFLVKETGIVAGLGTIRSLFHVIDDGLQMKSFVEDGSLVESGTIVGVVDGSLASILKTERTALNILQRMSGIATLTRMFVEAVRGTRAKIIDTRKTAPGLRILDKLAVTMGGGTNHRFGLDDMVLIKDNHITAAGSVRGAIKKCTAYLADRNLQLAVEVETKSIEQVREALAHTGIHRIMLDNFPIGEMRTAVELINHVVEVEASGNVSLATVRAIAETGVDFISVGALTHSPKALDISLKINPQSVHTH